MFVIKILDLVTGDTTPYDGMYVKEYDPDRHPDSPHPELVCHLVLTDNPHEAMHFSNIRELHGTWAAVSKTMPTRPDGKPNRPLTAFTCVFVRV